MSAPDPVSSQSVSASEPTVIVLGAGIIGLTTAHRLASALPAGSTVTVLAKANYGAPPANSALFASAGAAGMWYAFHADGVKSDDWALASLHEFRRQIAAGVPGLRSFKGVMATSGNVEIPSWAEACGLVVEDSNQGQVADRPVHWTFSAPIVNMDVYLPWLEGEVKKKGVKVKVIADGVGETLEDVVRYVREGYSCDVLVNCTGMGARKLCGDDKLKPGRGVTAILKRPPNLDSFYMEIETRENGTLTYVFPRGDFVTCGGCYQLGNWEHEATWDEVAAMLKKCRKAVPELKNAELKRVWTGFRPVRDSGIRFEVEQVAGMPIVHSYGHGGGGVTVSWGAADDVVKLTLESLKETVAPLSA